MRRIAADCTKLRGSTWCPPSRGPRGPAKARHHVPATLATWLSYGELLRPNDDEWQPELCGALVDRRDIAREELLRLLGKCGQLLLLFLRHLLHPCGRRTLRFDRPH